MSLPLPVVCEPSPDCCQVPSPPFYGQGQTYLSAQTGFLLSCPPGFSCDAGFYPTPIIVPKGGVTFTPPTGGNPLRFTCCDGSIEVRTLPDGYTQDEFDEAAQSIADAAAAKFAQCIADQYNQQHATPAKKCTITTASPLPSGDVGVPYSTTLTQTGATLPVTWSLLSGALPPGLALSSAGVISGTPTGVAASYGFVVRLSNTAGTSCTKLLTLTINACDENNDWCDDPGSCRLRVKDFNPADWVAGTFPPPFEGNPCDVSALATWDGSFPTLSVIAAACTARYDANFAGASISVFYDIDIDATARWQVQFETGAGTLYHGSGSTDPTDPFGPYTKLFPDFSCTGPASLTLEGYTP